MKINTLIAFVILIGCNKVDPNRAIIPQAKPETSDGNGTSTEKTVINLNREIISVLKNGDHKKLSSSIHPEKGIRFSMYSFISAKDKTFSKLEFEKYIDSDTKFTFGEKDGSGAVFTVSLNDYLEDWIFKKDFNKAKINYQSFEGKGNTLNNIKEKYPDAITVENYLAGTVEYSYMDWNSLILIFEKSGDQYFLVGIANNQWTV